MTIGGLSIILILGIVNFILLIFQLLSGLHLVRVPVRVHKTAGIVLFVCAALHGLLGFLAH